jgi:hypothetical protein
MRGEGDRGDTPLKNHGNRRNDPRGCVDSSSVSSRFGSDQERRRRRAAALYRFEMALREQGAVSDFVYDAEQDLFCFPEDGRFAFSREWADVKLLEERGYLGRVLPMQGEYLSKRVASCVAHRTGAERGNELPIGPIG